MLNFTYDSSNFFAVTLACFLIFFARIADVSIGTLRIISLSKGRKFLAPFLGFIEISIWLTAIQQVLVNQPNIFNFIAYAAGFSAGNYFGILIENRLALGFLTVRMITNQDTKALLAHLKLSGFGYTELSGQGATGEMQLIFIVIKNKDRKRVEDLIKKYNPHAFYSIDEIRSSQAGIFPTKRSLLYRIPFDFINMIRKAK